MGPCDSSPAPYADRFKRKTSAICFIRVRSRGKLFRHHLTNNMTGAARPRLDAFLNHGPRGDGHDAAASAMHGRPADGLWEWGCRPPFVAPRAEVTECHGSG